MDILSAATLVFLTMDPIGNVPVFLSALEHVAPERRTRVVIRELLLALAVMTIFLLFGQHLLGVLHLSEHAIRISGGIILFLIALKMVFPVPRAAHEQDELQGEPLLVPLAVPMVAGPSVLATLLLLATSAPERMPEWLLALLGAWAVGAVILLSAGQLKRILGRRGIIAMERLMGMLLIGLAVQMLMDGITAYLRAMA